MNQVVVIVPLIALWVCTLYELAHIDVKNLKFIDGILGGAAYYLGAPLVIALFLGQLHDYWLLAGPYIPMTDVSTTLNLYLGWAVILALHLTFRIIDRASATRAGSVPTTRSQYGSKYILWLMLAIYLVASAYVFVASGRGNGGSWSHDTATALEQSSSLVLIANIANDYRAMAFGLLIFLVYAKKIDRKSAVIYGILLAMFDVVVTFNRISVVYLLVMLVCIYRSSLVRLALVLLPLAPAAAVLSAVWQSFRGGALDAGFSADRLGATFDMSYRANAHLAGDSASAKVNSLFESSNLEVFNYLVKNMPNTFSPLWGQTFILRPLTVFVPAAIWHDKPSTFGVQLGLQIQGIKQLALNSTLFGEAYGNFYMLWPIAIVASLALLECIFRRLGRYDKVFGFFGAFVGIALWRFDMTFAASALVTLFIFELARRLAGLGVANRAGPLLRTPRPVHRERPSTPFRAATSLPWRSGTARLRANPQPNLRPNPYRPKS